MGDIAGHPVLLHTLGGFESLYYAASPEDFPLATTQKNTAALSLSSPSHQQLSKAIVGENNAYEVLPHSFQYTSRLQSVASISRRSGCPEQELVMATLLTNITPSIYINTLNTKTDNNNGKLAHRNASANYGVLFFPRLLQATMNTSTCFTVNTYSGRQLLHFMITTELLTQARRRGPETESEREQRRIMQSEWFTAESGVRLMPVCDCSCSLNNNNNNKGTAMEIGRAHV